MRHIHEHPQIPCILLGTKVGVTTIQPQYPVDTHSDPPQRAGVPAASPARKQALVDHSPRLLTSSLSFTPLPAMCRSHLCVVSVNSSLTGSVFNVSLCQQQWLRENGFPSSQKLPGGVVHRAATPLILSTCKSSPSMLSSHGRGWLCSGALVDALLGGTREGVFIHVV